jgi:signal transduction histidine kinase
VIEAAADAERFSLSIEDDGVGLGGASPGRGLGFMRRRLAHVGGQLVLGPSRGFATGLRVEASVPRAPSPVDAAAAAHGEFVLGQRPAGD